MTNQPHALPTLNQIRKAHGWKRDYEKYLPISRFVFRPVGFLLTWTCFLIFSIVWTAVLLGL
jgi:hypothetical protein